MRWRRGARRPAAALALAAGLLLAGGREAAPAPAQVPSFTGEVRVEELGLVFEPPPRRSLLEVQALSPGEVLVHEDGLLRRVTRVEEAESAGSWSLVVWIDRPLAAPETVFAATLALAKEARALAGLGTVEVIVAEPAPRTLLAPTREARRIEQELADLAGAARVERDRSAAAGRKPDTTAPPAAVRRQCDRLLATLAGRRDRGPHALLWVAARGEEGAMRAAGRLLAAYRWVTLPLPVRREDPGRTVRPESEGERWLRDLEEGFNDATVPRRPEGLIIYPPRRRGAVSSLPAVADLYLQPDLAPLRALVEETAGHLVGFEAQLAPALAALGDRWQLWIQRPAAAPAPDLHRLEATTIAGRPLRTFRWSRSAPPPALAEARLGALLADGAGRDPLPARLGRGSTPRLELDLGPFRAAPRPAGGEAARAPRPFRVSLAIVTGDDPPVFRHEVLDAGALAAAGWRHAVSLPASPAAGKVAVVVEDLAAESWAGAVAYPGAE